MKKQRKIGWLKRFITGWLRGLHLIEVKPAEEALSQLRLRICAICPKSYKSDLMKVVNGNVENVSSLICNACHCPCLEKSLVVSEECPLKKW